MISERAEPAGVDCVARAREESVQDHRTINSHGFWPSCPGVLHLRAPGKGFVLLPVSTSAERVQSGIRLSSKSILNNFVLFQYRKRVLATSTASGVRCKRLTHRYVISGSRMRSTVVQ